MAYVLSSTAPGERYHPLEWTDRGPQDLRNVASLGCLGMDGFIQGFPNSGHYLHPWIQLSPGLAYMYDPF